MSRRRLIRDTKGLYVYDVKVLALESPKTH
jgi:hypothetical protein